MTATGTSAPRDELLIAADEDIEDAVSVADPMVLRGLLYQLTGDESLKRVPTDRVLFGYLDTVNVVDDRAVTQIRAKAATFLKQYRDRGAPEIEIGPESRLQDSLGLTAGVPIEDAELDLWIEQLGLDPWCRGMTWSDSDTDVVPDDFLVAVIGAGMGGLNAAIQLQRSGIPFVVLERNGGVGGTWHSNRYPGARVDSPSRIYSHVYAVDYEFPNLFCAQPENEKYFNWMADHFDVRKSMRFHTEVTAMDWDDDQAVWRVSAVTPDGPRTFVANAVISGVGPFSRYELPDVPGRDTFGGAAFHTAQWPEDLDVVGKRLAIVGSGCSGYQLAPVVAKEAEHTFLFQRTPSWCFELPGYLSPLPPQSLWLDRNMPFHANFVRFRLDWLNGPASLTNVFAIDSDYQDEQTLSQFNKTVRDQRLAFLEDRLGSRPDLLRAMTPQTPPFTSRPVLVDAGDSVFDAMLRDNFTLVTSGIDRITESGIRCDDGEEIELDVIAFATGYRTNDYLWPMEVSGVDGRMLSDLWAKDGARAYIGTMLPGFPNLFLVYGPNSNPTAGLSVVDFEEMVVRFALECVRGLLESGKRIVDVSADAYDRYNTELDRWEAQKTYSDRRVANYYKNSFGRTSFQCPIDGRWIWDWLRSPVQRRHGVGEHAGLRPHFGEDLLIR